MASASETGKPRKRGRLRKWWAKGSPERGDWHWIVVIAAVVITLLAGVALAVVAFGGGTESDWSGRMFTYRNGRLDVDIGNVLLLAAGLGLIWDCFGPYKRG